MAQPVSTKFTNAQGSDANLPVAKVQIVLGNYFNSRAYGTTIVSTGDDASGNYPASGAIDGDRTEINEGPAATADNGIGKSTWLSATIPTAPSPVQLNITLSSQRTINRIKIYSNGSTAPQTYQLVYYNGSSFVVIAATSDIVGAGQVSITATHELDIVDFPDVTATAFFLTVFSARGQKCQIIEIEAYRIIDISERVKSVKTSRQRDYKLSNPMAATVQIGCINTDRYFSVNHTPTASEITDGFVNTELKPGVGIIVQMGFNTLTADSEFVTVFTGEIDSITISPMTRDAVINGRDIMKHFVNKIDSTKLKQGQDIAANIQYILNRANVSNYEMAIDTTGINIDYFFSFQQAALDTIRDLVQAAGDAAFFVNELGISTFKDYTGSITNQHLYTSEIDWEAGTLSNVSTLGVYVNQLAVPPQYIPTLSGGAFGGDMVIAGGLLSLPQTTAYAGDSFAPGAGTLQQMYYDASHVAQRPQAVSERYVIPRAGTITSITIGGWSGSASVVNIRILSDSGGVPNPFGILYDSGAIYPTAQATPVTINPALHVAAGTYWITIQNNGGLGFSTANLATTSDASRQAIGNYSHGIVQTDGTTKLGMASSLSFTYDIVVSNGTWTSPWYNSESLFVNPSPVVNNSGSYPAGCSGNTYLDGSDDGAAVVVTYSTANLNGSHTFAVAQHRYWRIRVDEATTDNINVPAIGNPYLLFGATGTWISPVLDTGASTSSLGSVTDTRVLNGGTITYYTRTSPNGITWDAYVATSPTGVILSTVQRYIQTMVVIGLAGGGVTPLILDITVSWISGTGSPKYPAISSFTFSFDSSLLDVKQELADNLGGDSSILNDITVQAQPLVITGTDADNIWQGTIGTPPSNISVTTPKSVLVGDIITVSPIVSGGMDISRMSGANPAAAVVTFAAGAAGSWVFSSIHPTLPVLVITITASGNITDLRIIGKTFQNASYLLAQNTQSLVSIAQYGDRQLAISNQYITSTTIASAIAAVLLSNFKDPTALIPSAKVRLCPALQLGDRVTVSDSNLDLTADYIVVGVNNSFEVQMDSANLDTDLTLLKVPQGS